MKIRKFTDLEAWKESHKLVLMVYKVVKKFPPSEQYILTSQILRAAISISSNISEGFSRQSKKEKVQFYFTAKGSLTELQNQLIIARDLSYINSTEFTTVADQTVQVHKLINGLIKTASSKNT